MTSRSNDDAAQIQIRFVTKQRQYAVSDYPLSVYTSIVPKELNTLVNELLKESKSIQKEEEFDFLIFSQFLHTSLGEHITEQGVSIEKVIDVEYVKKHPPLESQDRLIHDDWVSTVAVCEEWILTGCYDNTVHIWTSKGEHQLVISGHTSPVKAVAWIFVSDDSASFVSAAQDQIALIWEWDIAKNSVECICMCKGHERSIDTIGINHDKTLMATGSWDTSLKIWLASTQDKQEDEKSVAKRPKIEHNKIRVPKRTIKGHKDAISGVKWFDSTDIITSSWDRTVKIWDSESGSIKYEIIGDRSYFDVDYSPLARAAITASADKYVRLYDPRSSEGAVVKAMYSSHTQWIQCVCWSAVNEHLFLSGACDDIVKLWDTRSSKAPLLDLIGHEDKVLCCDWSNPRLIASGGADNTLRIFKHAAC